MTGRHPATEQLLEFFAYDHLPRHLQGVSKAFADLANEISFALPDSAELTAGLRKLLEAKDCAVRATVAAVAAEEKPVDELLAAWTKAREQRPPRSGQVGDIGTGPC